MRNLLRGGIGVAVHRDHLHPQALQFDRHVLAKLARPQTHHPRGICAQGCSRHHPVDGPKDGRWPRTELRFAHLKALEPSTAPTLGLGVPQLQGQLRSVSTKRFFASQGIIARRRWPTSSIGWPL